MFDPMKKFLLLPLWARLTIGLGVTASMFALIWWLGEKEEAQEPTLMEVCWHNGQAHYPERQEDKDACPGGTELLQWTKNPKTLYWDFGKDFDVYRKSHRMAVDWVNDELGFEALVEVESGKADITITHGSANEGAGQMSTSHTRQDGEIRAVIQVKRPGNIRQWMLEEQHELLHALGLAHDRRGIMSETLEGPDDPIQVWLLHDKDKKALQELLR